jgi:hypothetical protein
VERKTSQFKGFGAFLMMSGAHRFYEYHKKYVPPYVQKLLFRKQLNMLLREDSDVNVSSGSLMMRYMVSRKVATLHYLADDL